MIPELIFEWAKRTPDSTAIVYNGAHVSYGSFAQRIAMARGYFARQGCVGSGHVLLAIHNLLDFWVLSLALRSLGLTTVMARFSEPLDAGGVPDVRFMVTTPAEDWPNLDRTCAAHGLPLLSVSLNGEHPLDLDKTERQDAQGGHVLRTSGTTGNYKMVLMSPAIDFVFLRRKAEIVGMNQDTVLCAFAFPAWTAAGYRWAASPWTVGATTLIEQGSKPDRALLRAGITHAVMVPAVLAGVLAAPAGSFPRNESMHLSVGGGAMTQTQVEQAKTRITPRLFNWLASTEAGGIALTSLAAPEDHLWHRLAPGRVVEVVDEYDRSVPFGEIGRVRVSTAGGPSGYLHDNTATEAFFKGGYFYPGDLAVMRSDGRMALQGRVTDIINVMGRKISPAPIEGRLAELFGVGGVCLFSMQNVNGEEEIHVVIETTTPIKTEQLTAVFGQEFLGFTKIHVHQIAALARNQMGKLLRQDVRAQALSGQLRATP